MRYSVQKTDEGREGHLQLCECKVGCRFVLCACELLAIWGLKLRGKEKAAPNLRFSTALGWLTGFEPATSGTTNQRSNQLSYSHHLSLYF